jgi:hypothetical protein
MGILPMKFCASFHAVAEDLEATPLSKSLKAKEITDDLA